MIVHTHNHIIVYIYIYIFVCICIYIYMLAATLWGSGPSVLKFDDYDHENRAGTFIPMPMPKTVCRTFVSNEQVQYEGCRTFGAGGPNGGASARPSEDATFCQSCINKGTGRQGMSSFWREVPCFSTMPCRHVPLLVHFS